MAEKKETMDVDGKKEEVFPFAGQVIRALDRNGYYGLEVGEKNNWLNGPGKAPAAMGDTVKGKYYLKDGKYKTVIEISVKPDEKGAYKLRQTAIMAAVGFLSSDPVKAALAKDACIKDLEEFTVKVAKHFEKYIVTGE